jgi:hypothetical protein
VPPARGRGVARPRWRSAFKLVWAMVAGLSVRLRGAFSIEERVEGVSYGPPPVGPDV